MDTLPSDLIYQILNELDSDSLTQVELASRKYANIIAMMFPERIERTQDVLERVTYMSTFVDESEKYRVEVINNPTDPDQDFDIVYVAEAEAEQRIVRHRQIGDIEYFLPNHFIIDNHERLMDQELLLERCFEIMRLPWTQYIQSIKMINFSLTGFMKLLELFPNKKKVRLYSTQKICHDTTLESLEEVLTVLHGYENVEIKLLREIEDRELLLDDTTLECLISNLSKGSIGSLYLSVNSSVSLSVLLRFCEAISNSPLKPMCYVRRITMELYRIYGDEEELEKFLSKAVLVNINKDTPAIRLRFGLKYTEFNFLYPRIRQN